MRRSEYTGTRRASLRRYGQRWCRRRYRRLRLGRTRLALPLRRDRSVEHREQRPLRALDDRPRFRNGLGPPPRRATQTGARRAPVYVQRWCRIESGRLVRVGLRDAGLETGGVESREARIGRRREDGPHEQRTAELVLECLGRRPHDRVKRPVQGEHPLRHERADVRGGSAGRALEGDSGRRGVGSWT